MTSVFRLGDVAPEAIMKAALLAANRAHSVGEPTNLGSVQVATGLGKQQADNAIKMAVQLRLLREDGAGTLVYAGDANLRNCPKNGLPQFFRAAAQQFPPFLLYMSFLVRGYAEIESARQTASVFGIGLEPSRIATVFGRWSRYAEITDEEGNLDFVPKEILDFGFLNRLHEALRADLSTKTFVINEMGNATAADLYASGLDLDAIARALVSHQQNPHDSLRGAGNLLETYLAQLSQPAGGPSSQLGRLLEFLAGSGNKVMLRTHRNLGYGAVGFRNAADHGSDPDTGKPWALTPEAALVGTLLVLLTMKSIAHYLRDGTQEV